MNQTNNKSTIQGDDARLQKLTYDLERLYTSHQPPAQLTWANLQQARQRIEATHKNQATRIAQSGLLPPPLRMFRANAGTRRPLSFRLALVLTLLIVALVLAGTASAYIVPVLQQVLGMEPATQHLLQSKQYSNYHLSKTYDGFTITIEKAYADSNRVIIGYTIQSPAGRDPQFVFSFAGSVLKTAQGVVLPGLEGIGSANIGINGNVFSFDAANIQGNPKAIQLDMSIPYGYLPQNSGFQVKGYLMFDFSVPFHLGRVANIHQSLTVNGKTVTLDRVVVTPSETRLYIEGLNNQEMRYFTTELSVESQQYQGFAGHYYGATMFGIEYNQSLFNKHGVWTLVIKRNSLPTKASPIAINGGPWTFHFVVP